MKPKNTVVLVIIAHVGLFLIWACMAGCDTTRKESIAPHDIDLPDVEETEIGMTTRSVERETRVIEGPITPTEIVSTRNTARTGEPTVYDEGSEIKYVVQQGDSVWKICKKFKVTQEELCDRNDIRDAAMIRVGRELYIPKREGVKIDETMTVVEKTEEPEETTETVTEEQDISNISEITPQDEETIEEGTAPVGEAEYIIHEVVSGDTIWKISRTYGVKSDAIIELNNIVDPTKIQIGQKLKIPKSE